MNIESTSPFPDLPSFGIAQALDVRSDGETLDIDSKYLSDAVLVDVQIDDMDISGSVAKGLRFERCTFTRTRWHKSEFFDCRFVDCRFVDSRFQEADFVRASFASTSFVDCVLFETGFFDGELSDVSFIDSEVTSMMFRRCTSLSALQAKGIRVLGPPGSAKAIASMDASVRPALEALGAELVVSPESAGSK